MNFKDKINLFLENPKKIENTFCIAIDHFFQTKLKYLLPENIYLDFNSIGLIANEESVLSKKLESIRPEFLIEETSFSKCINEDTLQILCELASTPGYEPSKEFLVKLLNQKPIVELFAGIIESSIIEFNKKINPFFGAIQATGLDKQIKQFVYPFLPGLLSKIADFIYNSPKGEEGRELIKNSVKVFLTSEFSEFKGPTPEEYTEMTNNLLLLKNSIANDSTLGDMTKNVYKKFRVHLLENAEEMTLGDFMGIKNEDFQLFKNNTSKKLTEVVINLKNKESIIKTMDAIFSEILL